MTNITRSNFQAHPFHLVSPSPWPLLTSIALLTLTTTGVLLNSPVLNQAICWNIQYLITPSLEGGAGDIGQSVGNLENLNFLGILRDYTLEFFCCSIPVIVEKSSPSLLSNYNLSYYLAGLIEADGTIIVPKTERSPKGRLNYPSIQIVFDSRDMPLAVMIQATLGQGSLSKKKKGANAYVLTFNSKESILLIVSLINGKMRTPKMHTLYNLIDWLNRTQDSESSIKKLPLNLEPLDSNP